MALAAAFSAAAQTTENMVIEETNGNKTTLATSRIAGVLFEDAPSYTKAEYMLSASYATIGSNGVYTIELGTDEPDEYGQPSTVGGMQASLQLIGTILHINNIRGSGTLSTTAAASARGCALPAQ